jgi:hypothetical protein
VKIQPPVRKAAGTFRKEIGFQKQTLALTAPWWVGIEVSLFSRTVSSKRVSGKLLKK